MNNFIGTLISLVSFGIIYLISKMDMYKDISSNPIFAVFMIFFFGVIGYFIMGYFNKPKENKSKKNKKGKNSDVFNTSNGGFNGNK